MGQEVEDLGRQAMKEIEDPGAGKRNEAQKQKVIQKERVNRANLLALSRVEQERTARSKSLAAEASRSAPKKSSIGVRSARRAAPARDVDFSNPNEGTLTGIFNDFLGI